MSLASVIRQAAARLEPYLYQTPCSRMPWLDGYANGRVLGKLEHLQRTGSFKFRGAMNFLLQLGPSALTKGVVTASAGNHGLGVAEAGQLTSCAVTVFVPETASKAKISKLREKGVQLILSGQDYDEAQEHALRHASESGLPYVHAFDDEVVIAGQGTTGLEIVETVRQPGIILVPVGGGGLLGGLASIVKELSPQTRIIGVQSEASPAMQRAIQSGKVVETPIEQSVADGLAGRFVCDRTLALAQQYCDEVVLVSEPSIRTAMKEIYLQQGWRVEGSAAVGVAAILEGKIDADSRECVTVITGGNISYETFVAQSS